MPSSVNVTVPVGLPLTGPVGLTVAVTVTGWPAIADFGEVARVVWVPYLPLQSFRSAGPTCCREKWEKRQGSGAPALAAVCRVVTAGSVPALTSVTYGCSNFTNSITNGVNAGPKNLPSDSLVSMNAQEPCDGSGQGRLGRSRSDQAGGRQESRNGPRTQWPS